jgi:lipid A 3-O-deacylase
MASSAAANFVSPSDSVISNDVLQALLSAEPYRMERFLLRLKLLRWASLSLVLALAACASQEPLAPPAAPNQNLVSEVRLGGFAHDPASPESGSADLNGEVLFAKPATSDNPIVNALIPRPHVGATVNFAGKTSQAYAGATWTYDITNRVFAEASFGGSVNDGKTGNVVPPGFNKVGCNALFRESASLGYRVSEHWSVMGTVEHSSNAGLCAQNRGLTNFGGRIGYSF